MFFEIKNGKLCKIEGGVNACNLVNQRLYISDDSHSNKIIVNTYNNRCFLVPKNSIDITSKNQECYFDTNLDNSYEPVIPSDKNSITFILAITYSCNLHCTYCYQQNDSKLDKRLISVEQLNEVLGIIRAYKSLYPEKHIDIGLFGGEPLLPANEQIIDRIFQFCRVNLIKVHIVTNGYFLGYYLKKLIIYRGLISCICPTIDSINLNTFTRRPLNSTPSEDATTN